jgi:hypothetical protein
MWDFPKAVLTGLLSAAVFKILEVLIGEKFTDLLQTFVFDIWYLWFGLMVTISYLLVLQVKENRRLEFDILSLQIYNWLDKRTYDSHGNHITEECHISFDDFIRVFPKVKKNILKACWRDMIEMGKIYKNEIQQVYCIRKEE